MDTDFPAGTRPALFGSQLVKRFRHRSPFDLATTLVCLLAIAAVLWSLLRWGVVHAVFVPDADACQAARGRGACWGVLAEKYRLIIFGRYPYEAHWRPLAALALVVALVLASCLRRFWRWWLLPLWCLGFALAIGLMRGGAFGLDVVHTDRWGGLPLTVGFATATMVLSLPLAILLALGRRSHLPLVRTACTTYIELVRGVPLISVLFMASFMFPLLLPQGMSVDVLIRVTAGITLFAAAYLAEVIRGGLQTVHPGQLEAAAALGLGYWKTTGLIALPQAFKVVVPAFVNTLISMFKDTSLVTIVSLYEFTGAMELALNSDTNWRPFKFEAYLFVAAVYFLICFAMSRYSQGVERRLGRKES